MYFRLLVQALQKYHSSCDRCRRFQANLWFCREEHSCRRRRLPQARFLVRLYVPLIFRSNRFGIRPFKGFKVGGVPFFLPVQNVKAVLVLNAELVLNLAKVAYAPSFSSSFRNSASERFLSNIFCTALYRSSVQFFCGVRLGGRRPAAPRLLLLPTKSFDFAGAPFSVGSSPHHIKKQIPPKAVSAFWCG